MPLSTVQTWLKDWREWLGEGEVRVPMYSHAALRQVEDNLRHRFYHFQQKFQAQALSDEESSLLCGVPCLKEALEEHIHRLMHMAGCCVA